jgi:hypothetical protein
MSGRESKKTATDHFRSGISGHDSLGRSDCDGCPTSDQRQCAFGYVAKTGDIIIRERLSTGIRILILAVLIALVASIAIYRASNGLRNTSTVLLAIPTLQLLTTAAVWLWVRDRALPHLWIRGFSPRDVKEGQSLRRDSKRDRRRPLQLLA